MILIVYDAGGPDYRKGQSHEIEKTCEQVNFLIIIFKLANQVRWSLFLEYGISPIYRRIVSTEFFIFSL